MNYQGVLLVVGPGKYINVVKSKISYQIYFLKRLKMEAVNMPHARLFAKAIENALFKRLQREQEFIQLFPELLCFVIFLKGSLFFHF